MNRKNPWKDKKSRAAIMRGIRRAAKKRKAEKRALELKMLEMEIIEFRAWVDKNPNLAKKLLGG